MEKTVVIGGKEVRMRVSARIPFDYRYIFGRDIITEMQKLQTAGADNIESFEVFENLAWLLAKNAGEEVHSNLPTREAIATWLDEFEDPFAIIEAAPEIMDLWIEGNGTLSNARKK